VKKINQSLTMDYAQDIVISGIAGRFPKSNNMKEFESNLYNKQDMIDDESRWDYFSEGLPQRYGKIGNLDKFDASFFSFLTKYANWTDPQIRTLLEHAYEAVLDAGVSPQSLVESNTGVFIGNSESESKEVFGHQIPTREGYIMFGNGCFYQANKISFALGLNGPSMKIDTACSSTAYALHHAIESIKCGSCDSALVGGTNLMMSFLLTQQFHEYVYEYLLKSNLFLIDGNLFQLEPKFFRPKALVDRLTKKQMDLHDQKQLAFCICNVRRMRNEFMPQYCVRV
jgi:acyl transferase domain-containing protein